MVRNILLSVCIISLILPAVFAYSDDSLEDLISAQFKKNKDICTTVKDSLQSGANTKELTKTAISMGHSACLVVKCAIEGGGSLEQVIKGALDAGATTEVISRCAIDAGVSPDKLAGIFKREGLPGLGYTPPPTAGPAAISVGLPGGETGGGFLSPSSF